MKLRHMTVLSVLSSCIVLCMCVCVYYIGRESATRPYPPPPPFSPSPPSFLLLLPKIAFRDVFKPCAELSWAWLLVCQSPDARTNI